MGIELNNESRNECGAPVLNTSDGAQPSATREPLPRDEVEKEFINGGP